MKQKVQRPQIGKLKTFNPSFNQLPEMSLHPFHRDLASQNRVILDLPRDHPDVRHVALIPRPGVRDLRKWNFHSITSTRGCISCCGTNAPQYATTSRTFGRPSPYPVPPGGPLKTSGIISRVKRSTDF